MRARGSGRILNVASTAAFQPGPWMSTYYATKSYVLHFSEGLAIELCGTGVTVSTLCPGPTATEFGEVAGVEDSFIFTLVRMTAARVAAKATLGFPCPMRSASPKTGA